jgi:Ni,Fe-hydrogenase I cytochrome b subunit
MENTPMFTNDAIVLGLLMIALGFVFYTSSQKEGFWKKFYSVVPALLNVLPNPGDL